MAIETGRCAVPGMGGERRGVIYIWECPSVTPKKKEGTAANVDLDVMTRQCRVRPSSHPDTRPLFRDAVP